MPLSIEEIQNELLEDFSFFEDWEDKYKYIIDLGKESSAFPEIYRKDENKVKGCQSQVWLHADYQDGIITFFGDSDAVIVKGLVALLLKIYDSHSPKEILESRLFLIEKIGLSSALSPARSNGLAAMIKQIKNYAMAFDSLNQKK